MSILSGKRVYLTLLLLIPVAFIVLLKSGTFKATGTLPIYGERYVPESSKDTVYHTVGNFTLTDQEGNVFTQDSAKGKIRVVNFFFARCQSVCPKMNGHLSIVFKDYIKSRDVIFISHTVDPQHDSAEVLKEYARSMDVPYKHWYFLTGPYGEMARIQNQYLLPKADGTSADQIAHSQHIILVDKEDRIRGAYDGLQTNEILQLKEHIKLLKAEYKEAK
ncbi:MAG TPA: SCO family protein, partial [Bacteroidia bacterium]|nr:SCO family protein [Bacteroidia bacterium]